MKVRPIYGMPAPQPREPVGPTEAEQLRHENQLLVEKLRKAAEEKAELNTLLAAYFQAPAGSQRAEAFDKLRVHLGDDIVLTVTMRKRVKAEAKKRN